MAVETVDGKAETMSKMKSEKNEDSGRISVKSEGCQIAYWSVISEAWRSFRIERKTTTGTTGVCMTGTAVTAQGSSYRCAGSELFMGTEHGVRNDGGTTRLHAGLVGSELEACRSADG